MPLSNEEKSKIDAVEEALKNEKPVEDLAGDVKVLNDYGKPEGKPLRNEEQEKPKIPFMGLIYPPLLNHGLLKTILKIFSKK